MADRRIIHIVPTYSREWPVLDKYGYNQGTETFLNNALILFADGTYKEIDVPRTLKEALDDLMGYKEPTHD